MPEHDLISDIMLTVSQAGSRLFRNNVGVGWVGKILMQGKDQILLGNPRVLRAGLCRGASDTVGWHTVTITPDMVGKPVAIFLAVEIKCGKLKTTLEQDLFLSVVKESGGIALVARSVEDVKNALI